MSERQLSLPGLGPSRERDALFFAWLPEGDDACRIVRFGARLCRDLGFMGQMIAEERLHITLHPVGVYEGVPGNMVRAAQQAGAKVARLRPVEIVFERAMSFDRRRESKAFVLRPAHDVLLMDFYRALGDSLKSVGMRRVASRFTPHMTLLYDSRVVAERPIDAIRWTARDVVLIHSLRGREPGQGKHVHLARWRLSG